MYLFFKKINTFFVKLKNKKKKKKEIISLPCEDLEEDLEEDLLEKKWKF